MGWKKKCEFDEKGSLTIGDKTRLYTNREVLGSGSLRLGVFLMRSKGLGTDEGKKRQGRTGNRNPRDEVG